MPGVSFIRFESCGCCPDGGGTPGADATNLAIHDGRQFENVGDVETVVAEYTINPDSLVPAILLLACWFTAEIERGAVAGTATFRVRTGGTLGAADGTVRATLTTVAAAYALPPSTVVGAAFARPAGPQIVKITAQHTDPAGRARIRAIEINFPEA